MHVRSFAIISCAALMGLSASTAPSQALASPDTAKATPATGPYGIITTVAGDGCPGFYGDGGPAARAELNGPSAVAVDSAGNLYIADGGNQQVRMVASSNGQISTFAGSTEGGYAGDGGSATKALLSVPAALALDSAGNLYIADTDNNVIRKVTAKTGVITTVAGNGYGAGPAHSCGYTGDNGPATKAELCEPTGVAVDAAGDIYVSDTGNLVIRKVTAKTGIVTTVAGGGNLEGISGDGLAATSAFLMVPEGIALDALGNVYIAETGSCLVREVNTKTGIITTVAGAAGSGYGQCGGTSEGVPATEAGFDFPIGVAVDSTGNLFITDSGNHLVRRVDARTNITTTVAGDLVVFSFPGESNQDLGLPGYTGDGGAATVAEIEEPYGVATDAAGNIFFADYINNAVRKVTATRQSPPKRPWLRRPQPFTVWGLPPLRP